MQSRTTPGASGAGVCFTLCVQANLAFTSDGPDALQRPVQIRQAVRTTTTHNVPVLPTDPVFAATSGLAAARRKSLVRFPWTLLSRRTDIKSAWSSVRALPILTVPLTDTPANEELTALLRKRVWRFRYRSYAVAVLEVPRDAALYRKGRSRQALRTNSAKARSAGAFCSVLRTAEEIEARFGEIVVDGWGVARESRTYHKWLKNVERAPHAHYLAACAADGSTLVFCKIIVDGEFARLHTFIQGGDKQASSTARFLLMDYVVEHLSRTDVRYLLVDSVLALSEGLRYYQQLVGYTIYNMAVAQRSGGA